MARTTIETLPTELICMVAELLPLSNLCALHATCKTVSGATEDIFYKAFFTKRAHLCTPKSIQALAEMAANEKISKVIKEVEIVTSGPTWQLYEKRKSGFSTASRLDSNIREETGLQISKDGDAATIFEQLWLEQLVESMWTGNNVALLAKAFMDLASTGREVSIALSDNGSMLNVYGSTSLHATVGRYSFGESEFIREGPAKGGLVPLKRNGFAAGRVVDAIAHSNVKLKALDLLARSWCFNTSEVVIDPQLFASSQAMWASLRILKLGIKDQGASRAWARSSNASEILPALLRSTVSLEELTVSGPITDLYVGTTERHYGREPHIEIWLVANNVRRGLRKLELRNVALEMDQYLGLLEPHLATLTEVVLERANIVPEDVLGWKDIFSWLLHNSSLERLSTHRLGNNRATPSRWVQVFLAAEHRSLHGKEAVRVALEEMSQSTATAIMRSEECW